MAKSSSIDFGALENLEHGAQASIAPSSSNPTTTISSPASSPPGKLDSPSFPIGYSLFSALPFLHANPPPPPVSNPPPPSWPRRSPECTRTKIRLSCPSHLSLHPVPAGADRTGHLHSSEVSAHSPSKVVTSDTAGNLLVIEHFDFVPDTGPALHLHPSQEEWFYVMESEVRFQVGERRMRLGPGESILAPRRIQHTFSAFGSPARLLIAFTPAGKMEQYFIDAAANPELAPTRDFMNRYDVQWIGPSPFWKA